MQTQITGSTMPVLEVTLDPGERLVAESGELSWVTSAIQLTTSTKMAGAKGLFGAVKLAFAGGSLFMTEYRAEGGAGTVAFATKVPGEILPVEVNGDTYRIHHHGYLCGTADIELSVAFQQKLGAGIFGGEGFLLQKLGGTGQAWVELDGEVTVKELAAGETLRVHPGHVGMFEASVQFGITTVPGIKNKLFGGDGIFLASLTGPGKIWLQSLPLPNLAHALGPYLPTQEAAAEGGVAGAVIGNLLNR
jgi:uncharacterized protein (TIGR00266 family)